VYFVEEQDLALRERGEDGGQVSRVLDGGPAADTQWRVHFRCNDHGQSGLAESRGPGHQHVISAATTHF
jgi:hypothetical protein